MEYRIAPKKKKKKKVKTRPYSILIQKSKGCSAFDEQKVKNIAIEYRLQSIFPNPGFNSVLSQKKISLKKVMEGPVQLLAADVFQRQRDTHRQNV